MNGELNRDSKILVAVSGGVDSVCMFHSLVTQKYTNLGIVHFNHMIRDEAEDDANLVRQLANDYSVPFHYMEYDIPAMAASKKQSIELTAREARRRSFVVIMTISGYEWLALGHHADDQAETVLFNFMRGTGVHGLAGMLKLDEDQKIYRPLLGMTKESIYVYAHNFQLQWNEDITNHELDNDRSWLRNFVIPEFEDRRVGTKKVLIDTANRFQEISEYLKICAKARLENDATDFMLVDFLEEPKALQGEMLGILWERCNGSRKDFSEKVVFEVLKWLLSSPEGGTKVYFGKGHLTLKQGRVFFLSKEEIENAKV